MEEKSLIKDILIMAPRKVTDFFDEVMTAKALRIRHV